MTRAGLVGLLLAVSAVAAHADVTLFVGVTPPASRPTLGVAFGGFVRPNTFGFELEYTVRAEDPPDRQFGTFNVNFLVRLPLRARAAKFYASAGFGSSDASGDKGHTNVGIAARMPLAGPLLLRLDYRYFRFPRGRQSEVVGVYSHRLAAGIALGF